MRGADWLFARRDCRVIGRTRDTWWTRPPAIDQLRFLFLDGTNAAARSEPVADAPRFSKERNGGSRGNWARVDLVRAACGTLLYSLCRAQVEPSSPACLDRRGVIDLPCRPLGGPVALRPTVRPQRWFSPLTRPADAGLSLRVGDAFVRKRRRGERDSTVSPADREGPLLAPLIPSLMRCLRAGGRSAHRAQIERGEASIKLTRGGLRPPIGARRPARRDDRASQSARSPRPPPQTRTCYSRSRG